MFRAMAGREKLAIRRLQMDGYLSFARVLREIEASAAKLLADQGLKRITPAQANVMIVLFQAGEPIPARRIAEILALSEVTVGRFVHALEEARWIRRRKDPDDGRTMLIRPTRKAYDALPKFVSVSNELLDTAFQGFNNREIRELVSKFQRLAENVDERWQVRRRFGKRARA